MIDFDSLEFFSDPSSQSYNRILDFSPASFGNTVVEVFRSGVKVQPESAREFLGWISDKIQAAGQREDFVPEFDRVDFSDIESVAGLNHSLKD